MPTKRTAAVNFYMCFQCAAKIFLENLESNQWCKLLLLLTFLSWCPWPESKNCDLRCKMRLSASGLNLYSPAYSNDFLFPVRAGSVLMPLAILDGLANIFHVGLVSRGTATHGSTSQIVY